MRAGYGDYSPSTHFGRFAGCLTMAVGPVIVASMTAAITQALQLSEDDRFLARRMESNHLRLEVSIERPRGCRCRCCRPHAPRRTRTW